jgi:hypothetical protein
MENIDVIHVQTEGGEDCNVENISTPKANDCLWRCMMSGDMLNLLLLCIGDHSWDKEHKDVADGMVGSLL